MGRPSETGFNRSQPAGAAVVRWSCVDNVKIRVLPRATNTRKSASGHAGSMSSYYARRWRRHRQNITPAFPRQFPSTALGGGELPRHCLVTESVAMHRKQFTFQGFLLPGTFRTSAMLVVSGSRECSLLLDSVLLGRLCNEIAQNVRDGADTLLAVAIASLDSLRNMPLSFVSEWRGPPS